MPSYTALPGVPPRKTPAVHEKTCTKCRKTKPIASFKARADQPGKYRSRCRKCNVQDNKRYDDKASAKAYRIRKNPKYNHFTSSILQLPDTPHVTWLKRIVASKRKEKAGTLDAAWIEKWSLVTHCPVLGLPFAPAGTRLNNAPHPQTPSLDRIDPNAGYTPSNTRVVSFFANVAKNAWPEDQFRMLVQTAASNMRH